MTLADRLGELIKDKQITPYEICVYTGEKQSTISRILSGETKKPQRKTLESLASYLQTTVEYLKTGEGDKKSISTNILSDDFAMKDVFKILMDENKALHEQNATLRESIVELKTELQRLGGESISHNPGDQEMRPKKAG